MKYEKLLFKTITLNHNEKFANVYIHSDPNIEISDGLLTAASKLLSIGLNVNPKQQVFDGDIVEMFDWGVDIPEEPIMVAEVFWDDQTLGWDYFVNPADLRQYGDAEVNPNEFYRTNPNTINSIFIPEGYEIRTLYKF